MLASKHPRWHIVIYGTRPDCQRPPVASLDSGEWVIDVTTGQILAERVQHLAFMFAPWLHVESLSTCVRLR